VPILLGYNIWEKENFRFNFFIGPKLRINIGSSINDHLFSTLGSSSLSDMRDNIFPTVVGLQTGLQYELNRLKFGFDFELMKDMSESYILDKKLEPIINNNSFNINVSWEL
jgi:hypothetical protein